MKAQWARAMPYYLYTHHFDFWNEMLIYIPHIRFCPLDTDDELRALKNRVEGGLNSDATFLQ